MRKKENCDTDFEYEETTADKEKEETTADKNCHEAGHINKAANEESSACMQGACSRRNGYSYPITIWRVQISCKRSAEAQGRDDERPPAENVGPSF